MVNIGYMILVNPDWNPSGVLTSISLSNGRTVSATVAVLDGRYNFTLMGYCNIFDKRITTIDGPEIHGMESAIYWNEDGVTVWGIDASIGHMWDCGLSIRFNATPGWRRLVMCILGLRLAP